MANEQYRELVKERGVAKRNATRLLTFLKTNSNLDVDDLEPRKFKLEEYYQAFAKAQSQIEAIEDPSIDTDMIEHENERELFENNYFQCAKLINQMLRASNAGNTSIATRESNSSTPTLGSNINIQQKNALLPKIEIRPFDGNPIEWCSFHDTFRSLVHEDESIPPVQKFHLLKNSLRGNLTSITDTLTASEQNYYVAWDILKERCNRPRQIIQTHIKMIMELPEIVRESPISIRDLKEKIQMHVNALRALNQPVESWDSILVYIIIQKLDKTTRRAWERTLENDQLPKFTELISFLSKQERGEETEGNTTRNSMGFNKSLNKNTKSNNRPQAYISTQRPYECHFCKSNHTVFACEEFLKLNPHERGAAAREKSLCINCLRGNHKTSKCTVYGCKKCGKKHHTLLHFNNNDTIKSNVECKDNTSTKLTLSVTADSEVLLGTACVKILDKYQKEHECRILLDGCSQTHFISERLADKLKLDKEKIDLPFAGLGQLTTRAHYTVKTKIKSRTSSYESNIEFVALPVITGLIPNRRVSKKEISIPYNITLADPEFDKPAEIDALIGTTLFYNLLCIGQIKLCNDSIILQKTLFGWIVTGQIKLPSYTQRSTFLITTLDQQMSRFWEIEEIPARKHLSQEERACEKFYSDTVARDDAGRYVVSLPFNEKKCMIGESYTMAVKRFLSLEKKLIKNTNLRIQYANSLREYLELGHMVEITETDNKIKGFYIPHQAVVKEDNVSTKVRIVFDASAKSTTGVSLNDTLMIGPTIQDDLLFIIMRFRIYNVVLTADLQKMYRQIKIRESDTIFQKILWRDNEDEQIRVFMLTTVTQGTAPASFLAARTLVQLAKDEGNKFPKAAESLVNHFYVDDFLAGANSVEEAVELKNQLIELLKLGGFELHKWASNVPNIISTDQNEGDNAQVCLDSQAKRLLGINWDCKNDLIKYNVNPLEDKSRITKRAILSQIAQLFDPLGLLGPVIVSAKLIMQELWKLSLHWDETVPKYLHAQWLKFVKELPLLNQFHVERHIILSDAIEIQLHGFCDASDKAYGACIYIRSTNKENKHFIQLICAKSRVAPLKTISIPRLELCAATLLANLFKTVSQALKLQFSKTIFWSDSTITLRWIEKSPHLLKTFVANRVAEIQEHTDVNDWNHVSTNDNTADFISRGLTPSELLNNASWITGPAWLSKDESYWPKQELPKIQIPELRANITLITTQTDLNIFQRFSSIITLNRFVALCLRFIKSKRLKVEIQGEITVKHLEEAHLRVIKLIQETYFSKEISNLRQGKEISQKSNLLCLNAFIDDSGILRVGGRIKNSALNYSRKYPILLPRNDYITKLIIRNEHERQWHAGVQSTLNAVRQKYWPIDGKTITRLIVRGCVRCRKLNPKFPSYVMGDLPKSRVTQTRPFENTGVDYCGPFLLKEKKFRNKVKIKAYVAVFVCFVTKAVHLELVTDLTTETCLEAIKRFIARRGRPKNLYSDNATNFVGAKNEIVKIRAFLLANENNKRLIQFSQNEGFDWHFSPPRSPHFGGLWEAAVKSFKQHFYRTVGNAMFTYEHFNTCIVEIESILNSRPLTPISSDPNDLVALTPAHFLLGDCLNSFPERDLLDTPMDRLSVWKRVQKIKQHFWQRWHKDYLNELRTRSKWHKGESKIKIGMLVSIKEDNLPPLQWCIGRIVEVHPGADGVVRVASVKTKDGIYKRCVKKLAPLPIDIQE